MARQSFCTEILLLGVNSLRDMGPQSEEARNVSELCTIHECRTRRNGHAGSKGNCCFSRLGSPKSIEGERSCQAARASRGSDKP